MEIIQETLLDWGLMLPDWAFWTLLIVIAIIVVGFYLFGKSIKKVTDKYEIPFDTVDGIVKMMASLAIRLYVLKKGVEETKKVARIKNVAMTIDAMYPAQSSIRLSELINEVEVAMAKKFGGNELIEHKAVLTDLKHSIVKELIPVGVHIKDNENDPLINPREVASWINKGVSAVNYVQK